MEYSWTYMLDVLLEWYTTYPYNFKGNANIARKGVTGGVAYMDIIKHYHTELDRYDPFCWYIDELHEKMVDDGLLSKSGVSPMYRYTPKYKAFYFRETGGYIAERKAIISREINKTINTVMITVFTIVASIAGIGVYYFEYSKETDYDALPFPLFVSSLFLGLLALVWSSIRVWKLNKAKKLPRWIESFLYFIKP